MTEKGQLLYIFILKRTLLQTKTASSKEENNLTNVKYCAAGGLHPGGQRSKKAEE